jgi:hypothetical protein
MIEGLKVTIDGSELKTLCDTRAKFHDERARFYEQQKEALPDIDETMTGFSISNSKRPQEMMQERIASHKAEAAELRFIGAHINMEESFLLGRDDLQKLGIVSRGY